MPTGAGLPEFSDIEQASRRLEGHATRTQLIESILLNERTGGRILIKPECLQRTGSFKFRGAWNRISQLDRKTCRGGVVAYSSGNHAQGVAAAAGLRGIPALIVMPEDTPEIKKNNTRELGAEVVTYDRASQDRYALAHAIADERGAEIVPPFDHADIIAGQGTTGLELARDVAERNAELDAVLVCTGGGGLTAGIALAMETLSPRTRVYGVEPAGFDDHVRSLASGKRERNPSAVGSICDALLSASPGELTFAVNQSRLSGALAVSDDEVKAAVRFAFENLKIVAEPGGAVALAAVLSGKLDCAGKTVGVIISGGNVDPEMFRSILAEAA